MIFPDRTIARTLFASSNILLFSLVLILGCFWIFRDYRAMTVTTERIRAEQVQAKKELIQTEVLRSINYITYKKSQVQQRVRSNIQDHVYEAHTIASRIYDLGRDTLSEDQLKRIVVETLRPIRFNNGRGYYFATDLKGVEQLFADRPEMEQKDLLDITDTEGRYVIRDMISIAQGKGEGFYEYTWTKPGEREKDFLKIAFVKLFEPFNWFIGTGEYVDDMTEDIQEETLNRISQIRFGNDGYIFVMNSDGVILSHPDEKLIGRDIRNLADPDGIPVGQSLIDAGSREGGDYVRYTWPKPSTGEQAPKLSYVVSFPDWGWTIGTGVYLDDVEEAIAVQLEKYHQSVVQRIVFILVLIVSFIVISLVLTRLISKRLQNGIDRFMSFFRKAATSYEKIDPDELDFPEFRAIGGYANKLVDDFRTVRDELKSERDKAQSYLDTAGVMFVVLNREGEIALINKKGCEILGCVESEIIGKNWFDTFLTETVRAKVREVFSSIISGEIDHEYGENPVVCRDGTEKIMAWHNTLLRDPEGRVTGALSSGEDITERTKAEAALKYRLEFEGLIMDISTRFINARPEEIDAQVDAALRDIATFTGDDRSYVFQFRENRTLMDNTHEWCAEGIDSHIGHLKDLIVENYPLAAGAILRGEALHIPRVFEWDPEEGNDRREFDKEGIQSLLNVPMVCAGDIVGFVGLDSVRKQRNWPGDVIDLLRIAGEIFAGGLERKHAEAEIRQTQERYRIIAENARDVIWIMDLDLRYVYVSPSVRSLRGFSVEEAMQQGIEQVLTPESLEKARAVFDEVIGLDRSGPFGDTEATRTLELEMKRKDGSTVWTEVTVTLLRDRQGEPYRIMGITRDITERRLAEAAMRESEQRYRQLFENAGDAIFVHDLEGRFIDANRAAYERLGYAKDELLGMTVMELDTPEYAPLVPERVRTLKEQGIFFFESAHKRKDGTAIPLEITSQIVSAGGETRIMSIARDITERKQMEDQKRIYEISLLHSQKMEAIGTLAGGIAHDFNNILSAIIGYSELCLMDDQIDSRLRDYHAEILRAGDRARDLVKQILTFSRQEEGEEKPVVLKYMAKEVLKLLRASLPTTIEIKQNIRSEGMVMADPTHIHQVIMNLCTNAAHAMEDKGGVLSVEVDETELDMNEAARLGAQEPGSYMVLTVSDTGCGMAPEITERIFDPYFTTKEKDKGTGLGLAVVHGIVASNRGTISVESEPGKGTTFRIHLPRIILAAQQDVVPEKRIPTGTERILFVDDEPVLTNLARQMLEGLGYTVTTTTDSVQALDLFRSGPHLFDLVITDMTMPRMTGETLAQELFKIRGDVPVILCTGYSAVISEEKAREIGIRAFALKPLLKRDLANKIRSVLDK